MFEIPAGYQPSTTGDVRRVTDVSDDSDQQWVPVDALCAGLYVAELDRPWTDTPFMFQGFEITREEDLAILRTYCQRVRVYPGRSREDAVERMTASLRHIDDAGKPGRRPGGTDWSAAHSAARETFGGEREPDAGAFRKRVAEAETRRRQARELVDEAMEDVRLGRMVDTGRAREFIGGLIDTIARDARAALWLTNLREASAHASSHSVHVCILALAFGMHLGMNRHELTRLGIGALLHDVGKIRIPDAILDKPGPLTVAEFEVVKRHPQDGYDAVAASGGVAPEALQVIRLHHERRSGEGYPLGLKGDRIPRHVLLVAVADAYDAMTSDRPYRAGMEPDRVLQIMYNESAEEFGVELVQEFIRCMGIFPEGSLVELDNGAVGVVVASRPDARLQPVVLLVQTPDGGPYDKRVMLNLAAPPEGEAAGQPRRIARAVAPAECKVDITAYVEEVFGMGSPA